MNKSNIINKFFVAGALVLTAGFTSCDDFLTVLPSDKITEDDFWKSKADLNNVRASAYKQMTTEGITSRILYWGELRSDNLSQNDMTRTNIELLRRGVLHPTDGMFDWGGFYTGINYCNKVLEQGELMTQPNHEVDPSFRQGDWKPIKAEMISLRALYYLNLVKAYRNVPYVTHSISTDAEAMKSRIGATSGAVILGEMIDQMEEAIQYAAEDYSSAMERKGRFNKRSMHALLADMYLWRGCMLKHSLEKGDTLSVLNEETGLRDTLKQSAIDDISKQNLLKVIEHCDAILDDLKVEYDEDVIENPSLAKDVDRNPDYPYLLFVHKYSSKNLIDNVYSEIWGSKNCQYEGLFELQYDGQVLVNNTYNNMLSKFSSGSLNPSAMVGSPELTSSCENQYEPVRGFGKSDIRLIETFNYTPALSQRAPYQKNIARSILIPDLKNVPSQESGAVGSDYRESGSQNANWPFYRLTDVMLMKAEAIARTIDPSTDPSTETEDGKLLVEGFNLTNAIFRRCNPGLSKPGTSGAGEAVSDRFTPALDYAKAKKAKPATLLELVYNERQREFVGEGKRWYDIVRQAEATNQVTATLDKYINLTGEVKNRLKHLWALYVPIYSEELKVNGVEFGGGLKQNPVWDRYTVK